MTTLTFETEIPLASLTDVLVKLDEITPETNLQISLRENRWITGITIFPSVPDDKREEMESLAKDIGAVLMM